MTPQTPKTSSEIRSGFNAFFQQRGHNFVPPSPLLPADDPTLLFTNAGMNQFKPIFLGTETRDYNRAVNSQKCIRAGGKHNDLEDVGHDCYHHTFFEMLGNWSFGDYFKAEAIQWAWELLTGVWLLPRERLHATVFAGDKSDGLDRDDESIELWRSLTDIDPEHIHTGSKKDNFWEMGDTGPCGPCSEIHIDLTEDLSGSNLVNADDPRVMELWNLVFIQFNRGTDGGLSPLPARHVDTGLGLERIARVLQGKSSNYAIDLFVPIIEALETRTEHRYGAGSGLGDRFDTTGESDSGDVACRVIADHARTLCFAIADGIAPSNEGRGYVLRRILRRAVRYGRQHLGIERPFMGGLVPPVLSLMGEAYPELRRREQAILDTLGEEEESFIRTLDRGIELFGREVEALQRDGGRELPGEVVFDLYATYGFPADLTAIMAREQGLSVDLAGYEEQMRLHREASSAGSGGFKAEQLVGLPATDDSFKYETRSIEAMLSGWVLDGGYEESGELAEGCEAALVCDRTCFYAEQGGQRGDSGMICGESGRFEVTDTRPAGSCVLHAGRVVQGTLRPGETVRLEVSGARMDTMRNHSATHLLNWALRQVLGEDVEQAGSEVSSERLRFDFTWPKALDDEQLAEIERLANAFILDDAPVTARVMPLSQARELPGVRAVFGEKYPDPVRVVMMGVEDPAHLGEVQRSCAEFCGGTHLARTSQAGLLKIVSTESVAKGVRRITAVTGRAAVEHVQHGEQLLRSSADLLKCGPEDLPRRIESLQQQIKQLKKAPGSGAGAFEPSAKISAPAGEILVGKLEEADPEAMRKLCDSQRQKGAAAVFVGTAAEGKVTLVAMVSEETVSATGLKAGDWVKAVAPVVGGGGGGKPTLAQAGGKQPEKLDEALAAAESFAREKCS